MRNQYIVIDMKMARLVKIMSILLFVIFTLEVSGLTCFGEPLFKIPGVQGEYQIKAIDSDNGGGSNSPALNLEKSHCPCHLRFSNSLSVAIAFYSPSVQLSFIEIDDFPIKVFTNIFHPPKVVV